MLVAVVQHLESKAAVDRVSRDNWGGNGVRERSSPNNDYVLCLLWIVLQLTSPVLSAPSRAVCYTTYSNSSWTTAPRGPFVRHRDCSGGKGNGAFWVTRASIQAPFALLVLAVAIGPVVRNEHKKTSECAAMKHCRGNARTQFATRHAQHSSPVTTAFVQPLKKARRAILRRDISETPNGRVSHQMRSRLSPSSMLFLANRSFFYP